MLIDTLLQTDTPTYESGFTNTDLSIIGKVNIETPSAQTTKYEVNLYSFNGILIESYVENTKVPFRLTSTGSYLDINLSKYFDQSNLNSGKYYYILNSYDQIGGPFPKNLIVEEISSTRTEVRLLRIQQLSQFTQSIAAPGVFSETALTENQLALDTKITGITDFESILTKNGEFRNIFLNFGQNRLIRILNIELVGAPSFEILVKLYEPLPIDIDVTQSCEIDEVFFSYGDVVEYIQNVEIIDPTIEIQGPNFEINTDIYKGSVTGFQTWNDLLDVNLSTSQQIIDSYFGQSLTSIKLNIDYSKPEEFIFYSSAEERFNNFYYKIQLIEDYNSQLNTLNNIDQTIKSANIIDVVKKRSKIITGFDDFEKYLYFGQPNGNLYTFYTGSISTWPKTTSGSLNWLESYNYWVDNYSTGSLNSDIGYNLESIDSAVVKTYVEDTIAILKEYDKNNINSLLKTIPSSLFLDDSNSEYFVFVNMIGHHFDIIYTYINHLNTIHSREQHPLDGISKELLTSVADSFGWKLTNSKKRDNLWRYLTGLDSDGNYIQSGSLTPTITTEQYTLEIWNRIVNNLPYLLKTKGTRRSIQALMSCYGIPSTVINIKEYGGPSTNNIQPDWQVDKFIYSLEFGNNTGSLTIPWEKLTSTNRVPDSIQFRFKPDPDVILYPRTLLRTNNPGNPYFYITYDQPSGYNSKELQLTYYVLDLNGSYKSGSLNNVPSLNGDWTSVLLTKTPLTGSVVTSSFSISAFVKSYENIIYSKTDTFSASNSNFISSSNIVIGSSSFSTSNRAFDGNLNEFRYWSYTLNTASMLEYTKNPLFFGGNTDTDAYDYLNFRLPLSYLITVTGSYSSVHPNQSIPSFSGSANSSASFSGFQSTDLNGEDYTTFVSIPSLGSDNIYSSKIRNVNPILVGALDTDRSAEELNNDQTPKDTNLVGVYMSPTETIDSDIYNQLGSFSIDDYIGNPEDQNLSYYPTLTVIQNQYWKKYKNTNNFSALYKLLSVYDYSFFDQLKQLLPARVNVNSGVVIKQNVLERNKITLLDDVVVTRPMYEDTINYNEVINTSGEYPTYTASIDEGEKLRLPGVYNYSSSIYISGSGVIDTMVRFQPTGSVILQNTLSLTRQVFYPIYSSAESASIGRYNNTSYYKAAEVQDFSYASRGYLNSTYNGTKISAPGYGVPSFDLPDTTPVISIQIVSVGSIRNNPGVLTPPPVLLTPPVNVTNPNSGPRNNTGYSNTGFNIGLG